MACVKGMGGGNVTENALSWKFLDPHPKELLVCSVVDCAQENRALTPEGCDSWGFPPPSFFHPPMASSEVTIAHKNITELIPKQFRFGNSSAKITEYDSMYYSVRDSVILCAHYLPRPIIPKTIRFGNHRPGITENHSIIGIANLFTKCLFTILVPLYPPPPNQQNDGFPLEFLLKELQTELRTHSKNCEQTELWSNGGFWNNSNNKVRFGNLFVCHGTCENLRIWFCTCFRNWQDNRIPQIFFPTRFH